MVPLLVLIALAIAFGGFLFSTQATAGVYLAAIACLFAIFARMRQAHEQHQQVLGPTQALPPVAREAPLPVAQEARPQTATPTAQPMSLRMRVTIGGLVVLAGIAVVVAALSDRAGLSDNATLSESELEARIEAKYADAIREAEHAKRRPREIKVRASAKRTAEGWAITNASAVKWPNCLVTIGRSHADIETFYPSGTVTIERERWTPAPPDGADGELAVQCATQAPEDGGR